MILYENDHVKACYRKGTSEYILVTFGPRSFYPRGDRYWGENFHQKAGVTTIGIVSKSAHWYPVTYMEELLEVVREYTTKYRAVISYGGSMGGYAAVKHSYAVRATAALSFSPQYSIAEADLGFHDKRYAAHLDASIHSGMRIAREDIGCPVYVFYDPFHRFDRRHAEAIQGISSLVRTTPVYLTGHDAIRVYAGTNRGLRLFQAAMDGDMDELRSMALDRRASPAARCSEVLRFLRARNSIRRAADFLNKNLEHFPRKELVYHHKEILKQCLKHGERRIYDDLLAVAETRFPQHPDIEAVRTLRLQRWGS
jgi:hypothetical protein